MYNQIKEETAKHIVGNLPTNRWKELALGLWEATIEEVFYTPPGGYRLGGSEYNRGLYSRYLLSKDVEEIMQDGVAYVHSQLSRIGPKAGLEYKCAYKLLPNLNILIGVDHRDFYIPNESVYIEPLFGEEDL